MRTELSNDGVLFYDGEYEIAFYSNITDRIVYKVYDSIISYKDNFFIMNEINKYKRKLEAEKIKNVSKDCDAKIREQAIDECKNIVKKFIGYLDEDMIGRINLKLEQLKRYEG